MLKMSYWNRALLNSLVLISFFSLGCNDIPADNPFDPQAPPSVQEKSDLSVIVRFPLGGDRPDRGEIRLLRSDTSEVIDNLPISEANRAEQVDGEMRKTYTLTFRNVTGGSYILEPDLQGYMLTAPVIVNVEIGRTTETVLLLTNIPNNSVLLQGLEGTVSLEGQRSGAYRDIKIRVKDNDELKTFTDADGKFELLLPSDTWSFEISYSGYETVTLEEIEIIDGSNLALADIDNDRIIDGQLILEAIPGGIKSFVRLKCVSGNDCFNGFINDDRELEQLRVCVRPLNDSDDEAPNHCDEPTTEEDILYQVNLSDWLMDGSHQGRKIELNDLSVGSYVLIVTHPSYRTAVRNFNISPELMVSVDEIQLDPTSLGADTDVTIAGIVRADGQPTAGVIISDQSGRQSVESLDNGEFSLPLLHTSEGYTLKFNKEGYGEVEKEVDFIEQGGSYRFEEPIDLIGALTKIQGALRLRERGSSQYVTDADKIMDNTIVCARRYEGESDLPSSCTIDQASEESLVFAESTLWVNEQGIPQGQRFVFNSISVGRYKVIYTSNGYVTSTQLIHVPDEETGFLDEKVLIPVTTDLVTIRGFARLGGQEDHSGIIVSDDNSQVNEVTTFTGEYQLNVPFNSEGYTLSFRKLGYYDETLLVPVFPRSQPPILEDVTLAVIPRKANGIVRLDPEAVLQINPNEPRNQERELLDNVQVKLYRGLNELATTQLSLDQLGDSEEENPDCALTYPPASGCPIQVGTFEFQDLAVGDYQVEVQLEAFVGGRNSFTIEPNEDSNLESFFLTQSIREATITGNVLYPCVGTCDHSGIQISAGGYTTLTGIDGSFRLVANAVPVPYEVYASRSGFEQKLLGTPTLEPSETRDLGIHTLVTRPGKITGRIALPPSFDNSYLESVNISIKAESAPEEDEGQPPHIFRSGIFEFTNVLVGDRVITITAPGFNAEILNVSMSPGELRPLGIINLFPTNTETVYGKIRLEGVTDPEGHGNTSILLINTPFSALTNADGSFTLQAIPGDGRLRIAKVGYEPHIEPFEDLAVAEQRDLGEIELSFEPASIRGTIRQFTASGEVEDANVAELSLSRIDGADGSPRDDDEGIPSVFSQPNGFYEHLNLLGGSYTLTVTKTGYLTETRGIVLPFGSSINVDEIILDLERGSIVGTARREDLSALGGVTVRVQSLSNGAIDGELNLAQLTVSPDDRFSFARLPVGSYQVVAFVDGYQPTSPMNVDVIHEEDTNISLTLIPREYSISIPPLSKTTSLEVTLGGDADLNFYRFWLDDDPSTMSAWSIRPDGVVRLEGLSEGAHNVFFELATQSFVSGLTDDPSAFKSPVLSASFRIDTVSPDIGQAVYSLPSGATTVDQGNGHIAYQQSGSAVVALFNALDPTPASGILSAQIESLDLQEQVLSTVTVPFTPILQLSAALSRGFNQYRVTLIDAAGNQSEASTLPSIMGDSNPPSGTLSRLGNQQTSVVNVTLQLDYEDADSSPLFYRLYQSDQSPGAWQSLPPGSDPVALNFALTPGDSGDRTVTGEIRDASGRTTALNEVIFRYDNRSAASPQVTLNQGALWTNTPDIDLSVDDPSSVDNEANGSYRLVIEGDIQEAGEYSYAQIPNSLTLSGQEDGEKRLSFMWIDGAGNRSPQTETSISIDRVAPSLASVTLSEPEGRRQMLMTINGVEETVLFLQTEDPVLVTLSSFDPTPSSDLVSVEVVSYDESDNELATSVLDYGALLELSPTTHADYRWYKLTAIDTAGNRSQSVNTLMVKGDQAAPSGSLTQNGETTRNNTLFTFDLTVADTDGSPLSYRLYETDQMPGSWVDITVGSSDLLIPFTVTGGSSGDKTISAQVKDAGGRVTQLNEVTVRYDVSASEAPEVSLDGEAIWTTDLSVSLAVSSPVSTDGELNGSYSLVIDGEIEVNETGIYDYQAIPDRLTLLDGEDGMRQVNFTWIDGAGNTSVQSTEMISVDRAIPLFSALSIAQPEGSQRLTSINDGVTINTVYLKTDDSVTAVLGALDPAPSSDLNLVEVVTYLEDGTVDETQTYSYSAVLELAPTAAHGTRSYGLTLIDSAGNRSATRSTDFVKGDAASPTGSLAINGSNVSNSTLFTIDITMNDTDGHPLYYRLYQEDQNPGTWIEVESGIQNLSVPFTVTAGQTGTRIITGQLKDASGRVTPLNTVSVTYDTTRSDAPVVTLDGGATWTTDLNITLTVDAPASSDVEAAANYTLVIAGEVEETGEYTYDNIPANLTLTDGEDGLRNIRFAWIDAAKNRSNEANMAISIDRVSPTFSALNLNQPENSRLISVTTEDQGVTTTTITQYLKTDDAVVAILSANDPSPSSDIKSIEVSTYDDQDNLLSTNNYDYTTVLEISPTTLTDLRRYALTLIDSAGNRSDQLNTPWVKGDQSDPTGTLAVVGESNSSSTLFSLSLDVSDDDDSPISYRLYQTDQAPGTWFDIEADLDSITIPFTVTAGATGNRTITGEIKDAAGRTTTLNQLVVKYDVTAADPPAVIVNRDAEWTSSLQVTLTVNPPTSPDGEPANQHILHIFGQTRDAGEYGIGEVPDPLHLTFGSDGSRVLGFRWIDQAGNRSEVTEVTLLLDREPPSVRDFTLGTGSGYTTTRSIDLSFTCTDSMAAESQLVMDIQSPLQNSIINVSDVAYTSPYELTLDPQVGTQAITIKCTDAAGNFRERSGNEDLNNDGEIVGFEAMDKLKVYYDNVPPVHTIFNVENGVNGVAVRTQTVKVTTAITDADSGIDKVAVSEDIQDCTTASYIYPAEGEFQFLLSDPDGSRRLALCAKDIAGNILGPIQSNLVNLDRINPNFDVTIDDDSGWSQDRTLELTFSSTDDNTTDYLIEIDGDLEESINVIWPNDDTIDVLLSEGHGEKRIIINVYDAAGNQGSTIQETVVLDDKGPDLFSATLNPESQFSMSRNVDIAVNCVDDYASSNELTLQIEHVGQAGYLYNDTYLPLVTGLDVLDGEGDRVLNVSCIDSAGNSSVVSIMGFAVDTIAPSASSFSLSGLGPAGTSRSLQLTATIEANDATSGLKKLALFEDGNTTCADASYLTAKSPSEEYGISLTAGEGTRTVYLCLQDQAGNQTADRLSATIDIDTTSPSQGDLLINNGDEFTNNVEVELDVSALEAAANLMVGLNGDFIGAPIFVDLVDFPINVDFTNRNGMKTIQAILRDQAGNMSTSFSASIRLDTKAPEDGKVAYNFVAINNNPIEIQDLTIPLSIQDTIASTMQFWEVASQDQCGDLACDDPGDEVFSANTSFTVSGGDGEKRLCWRFCDQAGNSSNTGTGLLNLNQQFIKPRPVLDSMSPNEYTTYSLVNDNMTLPVVLTGSDIAASTQVQLGDYLYACETVTRGSNTEVESNECTQNQRQLCGTKCKINLPLTEGILKFPGRYLARLITPDPVYDGVGSSAAEIFFTVKAPPPTITYAETHGAVRESMLSNQNLKLNIVACGVVDNATFTFADQNGAISEIVEVDGQDNCNRFTVSFEVGGLNPYIDLPYMLTVVNPSPGGGFSEFPFVLTPPFIECPLFENCVYTLHNIMPSAGLNTSLLGASLTYLQPKSFAVKGSSVIGASTVTLIDRYRNNLSTIDLNSSGGALPLLPELYQCSPNVPSQLCPLNQLEDFHRLVRVEDHNESAGQALLHSVHRKDLVNNKASGELRRYIGCPGEPAGQTEILAGGVNRFALGDLDHDNDLDLVTAHTVAGEVQIRLGGEMDTIKDQNGPLTDACNQDVNADGTTDDCTLYAFTPMMLGSGHPGLNQLEQPRIPMGDGAYDVTLADLNNDGTLDIVTPDSEADTISIRYGHGDGRFGPRSVIVTDASGPVMVKAADMNQDGWSDLVVAFCGLSINLTTGTEECDANTGGVRVYLGDKNNQYTVDPTRSLTAAIYSLDIADVNHDGALDIIAGDHTNVQLYTSITSQGELSTDTPWTTHSVTANPPPAFTAGHNVISDVQLTDWNGNGSLDIVITMSLANSMAGVRKSNFIGVLFNNGSGEYPLLASNELYSIEQMLLDLNANHPVCSVADCQQDLIASNFTIGEFTGDGQPDLALALLGQVKASSNSADQNNWIAIIPGAQDQAFDQSGISVHSTATVPGLADSSKKCRDYSAGLKISIADRKATRISDLKAVDLDGDGAQELLALSSDAQAEYLRDATVGALMGWRGGSFPNASTKGASQGRSYPVDWYNNGQAIFGGAKPFAVAVEDIDNDGELDLIWHEENESSGVQLIVRLSNNGMFRGTDESKVSYGQTDSTGQIPIHHSIDDIDGDGDLDIVVPVIDENLSSDPLSQTKHNGFKVYQWSFGSLSCSYPNNCFATGVIVNNSEPGVQLLDIKAVSHLGSTTLTDRGILAGVTEPTQDRNGNQIISNYVFLYQKSGATFTKTEELAVNGSSKIVTGQLDSDQYMDVVSIGNGSANVLISNGSFNAGSYFRSNTEYPITPGEIWGADLADLDGDGDLDLIVLSEDSGTYTLSARINTGGGLGNQALEAYSMSFNQQMTSLRAVDMNHDQIDDLIIGNGTSDTATIIYGPYDFEAINGNRLMNYTAKLSIPMGRNVRDVNFGDFNQDGAIDLVTANGSAALTDDGKVNEALTIWESPQASPWRESLVLRSMRTSIPNELPDLNTITFPNLPRFVEKAFLNLSLAGSGERNTPFTVYVSTPEGQDIDIEGNVLVGLQGNVILPLTLHKKWQRGESWDVEVTGVNVIDATIALETWFKRPNYEQSPCTASLEGEIRLINTRLEICHSNIWGTVCDDSPASNDTFDQEAIDVVCQSLGFSSGQQVAASLVPDGTGTIWLDDVDCNGTESSITECTHRGFGIENCGHNEDVGIHCF